MANWERNNTAAEVLDLNILGDAIVRNIYVLKQKCKTDGSGVYARFVALIEDNFYVKPIARFETSFGEFQKRITEEAGLYNLAAQYTARIAIEVPGVDKYIHQFFEAYKKSIAGMAEKGELLDVKFSPNDYTRAIWFMYRFYIEDYEFKLAEIISAETGK